MDVKKIFKTINKVSKQEKISVYVVGGFVRDLLMGLTQKKDIDFVVEGSGLEFARKLDVVMKEEGSLVEFPDFDTARYVMKIKNQKSKIKIEENIGSEEEIIIEFAGARSEKYDTQSRKPKVEATTLEEDLSRRDFTVNAMAVPVNKVSFRVKSRNPLKFGSKEISPLISFGRNDIVDLFGGREDLKNKILKTPLAPDATFSDDPLRMMRAIRFAAQLNFAIDPATLEAIYRNRERIKIISAERVQEELIKLLSCPKPSVGLILMFQTHLLDLVLPEVAKLDGVEEIYGHQHKNNLVHL